jgi:hypothetical protein
MVQLLFLGLGQMKRYDIHGDGTIIEVSNREFLLLLVQFVEICCSLAKSYIVNHASGLADFGNEFFKSYEQRIQKQFTVAIQGIEDEELREQLVRLIELINMLSRTDDQIMAAYREAILQTSKSKKPIQDLKKEVYNYLYQRHLPPPVIVIQIAKETTENVPALEDLKNTLHTKMEQLLSPGNG